MKRKAILHRTQWQWKRWKFNQRTNWTEGKIGGALSFDNVDDFVDLGNVLLLVTPR